MKLYDANDKESIYWGLNDVFDFNDTKINRAIENQVMVHGMLILFLFLCPWKPLQQMKMLHRAQAKLLIQMVI